MTPIKLKITPDQVMALEKTMKFIVDIKPTTRDQKSFYSIAIDVEVLVHKLYRKTIKSTDLFNSTKKVNLILKFHEADMLTDLIGIAKEHATDKQKNDLLMLHNELEQKLT